MGCILQLRINWWRILLRNKNVKIRKWIELSDNFGDEFGQFQVTYLGEYSENGRKVGQWNILYRQRSEQSFDQIGGGNYIDGFKNRKWNELSNYGQDITFNGEYKNGLKIGRWDINYNLDEKNQLKAGSLYNINEEGSTKIGQWIKLSEGLRIFINNIYW